MKVFSHLLVFSFALVSCAAQPAPGTFHDSPNPYFTSTPGATSAPSVIVVIETPAPTNTPHLYIIQSGDTFSGLAEKFNIPQDLLRAANPNISPNSMPIGGTLLIPDPSAPLAAAPTPSPQPVPITQLVCHRAFEPGLWCFALIQNITPAFLENVWAQINLLDENNQVVVSQTAFAPLDVIAPNASLPVYAFFPNLTAGVAPQARLLSAMQTDGGRYLPAQLTDVVIQIDSAGKVARVGGKAYLPAESKAAARVWVAAVAYDEKGQVVGLKRWQGEAIQPGGFLPFEFSVASLAGKIATVQLAIQATP